MTHEAITRRIEEVLAMQLGISVDTVTICSRRACFPAWDSLKHLEILLAVEESLEIRFSAAEMTSLREPSEILECVLRRRNVAGG
jgi:acyl carrier protein